MPRYARSASMRVIWPNLDSTPWLIVVCPCSSSRCSCIIGLRIGPKRRARRRPSALRPPKLVFLRCIAQSPASLSLRGKHQGPSRAPGIARNRVPTQKATQQTSSLLGTSFLLAAGAGDVPPCACSVGHGRITSWTVCDPQQLEIGREREALKRRIADVWVSYNKDHAQGPTR